MTTEPDSYARIVAELRENCSCTKLGGYSAEYLRSSCKLLADRLEKLSAASVQVTYWLPIESAPKVDGEPIILGWSGKGGSASEGYWFNGQGNYWNEEGWRMTDDDRLISHACHPTHWMPLPAPPQSGESE